MAIVYRFARKNLVDFQANMIMAETIMRAIELAKKQLESPSHDYTVDFSMLKEICNDCNQSLNLPETDQI
jgi:hypothetical protein